MVWSMLVKHGIMALMIVYIKGDGFVNSKGYLLTLPGSHDSIGHKYLHI